MKTTGKKLIRAAVGALALGRAMTGWAIDLTSIPGPDDQGGMIMPMVMLAGTTLHVMFEPESVPELRSLNGWSPGDTFVDSSAWNDLLDPVDGAGALFNNQYGFMFSGSVPNLKSLGIRLLSRSTNLLEAWNYVWSQNRFDKVFDNPGDQILWNGSMWHDYFTLPSGAAPGLYTASFEIFIADKAFSTGTGFADYSPEALAAAQDPAYNTVTVEYEWLVPLPEPSAAFLMGSWVAISLLRRNRERA